MRPITAARLLGASMRLTRLVIHDELGQRLIQRPLDNVVVAHSHIERVQDDEQSEEISTLGGDRHPVYGYHDEPVYPDWIWLRDGLTCPACIGFWLTLGVVTLEVVPVVGRSTAWRVLSGALALNEALLRIDAYGTSNSG